MAETRVVVLGTGTPNADAQRSGPAVAIMVGDATYLIDAGPGVVRRLAATATGRDANSAVAAADIVFLTHLHSDHTLGLPDLIFSPWVLGREKPLRIFGPRGTKKMAAHLIKAWTEDTQVRVNGLERANRTGFHVAVKEVFSGVIYKDSNIKVTAVSVHHGDWREHTAFGYVFETADRKVVISGDCTPSDAIAAACNGCDLLLHEVYSERMLSTRPPKWQRYHRNAHTSSQQLAELADRAKPKLLVLYHQLFWGQSDEGLVEEVAEKYKGEIRSAKDLAVF